jgi:hypothetical protein
LKKELKNMSNKRTEVGVVDPRGKFHPHSNSNDVASAVATAQANSRVTGKAHHVAERDPATGKVTKAGPVDASNQVFRGR